MIEPQHYFLLLAQNLALMVTLTFGYRLITRRMRSVHLLRQSALYGVLFALIALAGMQMPVEVLPGMILDARAIVVLLAAPFGGIWAGIISAIIVSVYRIYLGGSGVLIGVIPLVCAALTGIAYRFWRGSTRNYRSYDFFILGSVISIYTVIFAFLFLDRNLFTYSVQILGLPTALLFPLAAGFSGILLSFEDKELLSAELLKESEAKFRALFDNAGYAINVNQEGITIMVNPEYVRLFGYEHESELIGKPIMEQAAPEYRPQLQSYIDLRAKGETIPIFFEGLGVRKDGTSFHADVRVSNYSFGGETFGLAIIRNIDDQILAQREIRYQAKLLESVSDAVISTDNAENIVSWNKAAEALYGWQADEVIAKGYSHVVTGKFIDTNSEDFSRQFTNQGYWQGEVTQQNKNGDTFYVQSSVTALKDQNGNPIGAIAVNRDISERKQAENQIKMALADKETLLQELYHRTKNNMQTIMGLINLHTGKVEDEQAQIVLKEIKDRILAMSLVHQKLYQSQNLSSIDLGEYIRELTALLMKSHQVAPYRVALQFELEPVPVLIDTAIPCGLILNELISNVFKHAFPAYRQGELRIVLKQIAESEIMLEIADNGVGLPPGYDPRKSDSIGLQTVFGIAEYQLKGKITCEIADGVVWRLQFSDTLYQPRV